MLKRTIVLLALTALLSDCFGQNSEDSKKLLERRNLILDNDRETALNEEVTEMLNGSLSVSQVNLNQINIRRRLERSGRWYTIQQRVDRTVDFNRNWYDYVHGFGDPNTNFWAGLETIYRLSKGGVKLRIDMWYTGVGYDVKTNKYVDFNNEYRYAEYNTFYLGSAATNYRLHVYGYHGTAGNALALTHDGKPFSTSDRNNYPSPNNACSLERQSGWWYELCGYSNLNGVYGERHNDGPRWKLFTGDNPVSRVEMKIFV